MTESDLTYLSSLPTWPQMALPNDQIDGLIPSCKVESWQQFVEAMRSPDQNKTQTEWVYRGQQGYDWQLSSTLSRQFDGGAINDKIRDDLLVQFQLALRGRGPDFSGMDHAEIWSYGQHFGLCTPLVDWTRSPFVALFFAFSEPDVEVQVNPSRAVFALNMTLLKEVLPGFFVEPRYNHNARLVNQAGLFTLTPSGTDNFASLIFNTLVDERVLQADDLATLTSKTMPDDNSPPETEFQVSSEELTRDLSRYICKIHIPNVDRESCLAMLRKMNIHHGSLFPDPGGASNFCNDWLARLIKEEKREALEKERARIEIAKTRISERSVTTDAKSSIDPSNILAVLRESCAGNPPPDDLLRDWAEKLLEKYNDVMPFDWPNRFNGRAKVQTELKRLLSVLGYPREYLDNAMSVVVEILAADYANLKNTEMLGGPDV
jgi:hypothetical protein